TPVSARVSLPGVGSTLTCASWRRERGGDRKSWLPKLLQASCASQTPSKSLSKHSVQICSPHPSSVPTSAAKRSKILTVQGPTGSSPKKPYIGEVGRWTA